MVKQASHKHQESTKDKRKRGANPQLVALVKYLAEWAAEQDFNEAQSAKDIKANNMQEPPE